MMATVFFMQPLGQLVAAVVGLCAAIGLHNQHGELSPKASDQLWRTVTGVGAFPALIAIIFRFTITDSGRFTLDVKDQGQRALDETNAHFFSKESLSRTTLELDDMSGTDNDSEGDNNDDEPSSPIEADPPLPEQFSRKDLYDYFITQGTWRHLAGTSACWFILDLAFYGLSINSPKTLAALWEEPYPPCADPTITVCQIQSQLSPDTFYRLLIANARRSIVTVSVGSIVGSIILIFMIDRIRRRKLLIISFLALAATLAITGISFFTAHHTPEHPITITLFVICNLIFNLGPNTLTFIIPAEIFATRYRGTCHGISAAFGKLGSVIAVALVHGIPKVDESDPKWFGISLCVFAGLMASGAFFAWVWLPEVQRPIRIDGKLKLVSRSLEDLGESGTGRKVGVGADADERAGLRRRLIEQWRRARG
jgi:MFS transporter, PHS family, inorganic phosphate transporter